MAKRGNQKLKLLYIIKMLEEYTDEKHAITTAEIIRKLEEYEIHAERKSIYSDIETLQEFGYTILKSKTKELNGYYMTDREFELPELKAMVDIVQSSKFITKSKSKELIEKLERFTSKYQAKQLERHVYVTDRIKTSNESVFYNIDIIHQAMQENAKISFQYFEWTVEKEKQFRRGGEPYQISPWQLVWSEEYYYLVGYDSESSKVKHYRVDKMANLEMLKEKREGDDEAKTINPVEFSKKTFGMFDGVEESVTIQFDNKLIGVAMERFGNDVTIRKRDEEHFSIRVRVKISGQFYGWLTGLGKGACILGPANIREEYRNYLQDIFSHYEEAL